MSQIRLVAPDAHVAAPALDQAQQQAASGIMKSSGPVLVTGGPGTGKSVVAVAAVAQAVLAGMDPSRVLLLAPTRQAAAVLRDQVSAAIGRPTGEPIARTPASVAFAILGSLAVVQNEPSPALITGAEQDVMLREILSGHRRGDGHVPDWDGIVPADATLLPGFREELRNLLMRAAEAGIDARQLHELGRASKRPEWVAAASVAIDYENATILRSLSSDQGRRYDPAAVTAEAAHALAAWEERATTAVPTWDLVVVDDFHDATVATASLLHTMYQRGARVALVGNADQTVQGYRGAAPATVLRALDAMGEVARYELVAMHRQSPRLARVSAGVSQGIGVVGAATAREWARLASAVELPVTEVHDAAGPASLNGDESPGADGEQPSDDAPCRQEPPRNSTMGPVRVLTAPHRYGQSRAIAKALRQARRPAEHTASDKSEPLPWSRMVVIARSGSQLRALRSDLLAADIPCQHLGDGTALHEEPAVRPLLQMVRIALGEQWSADVAADVLQSRVGGLDPVAVRRLRRALVREDRAGDGVRSSDQLLAEAMVDPARFATIDGTEALAAARVASAVSAAATRITQPGATPGAVIWAVWNSLGIAESWRTGALAGSDRDDADLDAVIALLKSAQVFSERMPEAGIGVFLEVLESQEFAVDSLGARAHGTEGVWFATPASAAGREWDVVVVAGVEEGAWPNLRIRDSVLGAQVLAEYVAGVASAEGPRDLHGARAAVLDDETRAFLVAVSRARQQLIVSAVDDGESRPSRYVAKVEVAAGVTRNSADDDREFADLRDVVAALRKDGEPRSEDSDSRPEELKEEASCRDSVARALAKLAFSHIPGADPDHWYGVAGPSTEQGFWNEGEQIKVSPSRIDSVRTCSLRWALETVGATKESSLAQNLGLLVHEIAAELPSGTQDELLAALDQRWAGMGGTETWVERRDYERARDMVVRFAKYVAGDTSDRVLVEQGFGVEIESANARVSGSADRVEIIDSGAHIVDLKTGSPISAADAAEHGQLMLYQLAAGLGAFRGADHAVSAALVFLSEGTSGRVRSQEAYPVEQAIAELEVVVDRMRGPGYEATVNKSCEWCPVRRSCPAQPAGAQVSES